MDISKYINDDINNVYVYINNPNNTEIINITDDNILQNLFTNFKEGTTVEYTEYHMKDMIYSYNNSNDGQKVYKKILKMHDKIKGIYSFDEEVLPPHRFPCTNNIIYKCFIKRTSYRVNNRTYINYEEERQENGEVYKYLYIHYKHSENVDIKKINNDIDRNYKLLRRMNIKW
jgi:hypothetical protein